MFYKRKLKNLGSYLLSILEPHHIKEILCEFILNDKIELIKIINCCEKIKDDYPFLMSKDNKKDIKERGILNYLYKKINFQLEKSF